MSLLGFQTLHCPKCDKTVLTQIGELVWQEGKGQSFRPLGWNCVWCHEKFDTEGAIKKIKSKELEDKIAELQATSGR
jgi:hypothetical protein